MLRVLWRFALGLVGAAVAIVMILALAIALRLNGGPMPLDAVTPYLAAVLGRATGTAVAIDHAMVALDGATEIEFITLGVRFGRKAGGADLVLPELDFELSLRSLLSGEIAPTRIVLDEPSLRLDRDSAGAFHLGLGGGDPRAAEQWAHDLLGGLAQPVGSAGPLGALRELVVSRAALVAEDRALGIAWRAAADMRLVRNAEGIEGELALAVTSAGGTVPIHADIAYRRADGRLGASLALAGLRPSLWANALPAAAAYDVPLTGLLRLGIDTAKRTITTASCELGIGAGTLAPPMLGAPVIVNGGRFAADYDPAAGRVVLKRLALDLGGAQLAATGTLDGLGDTLLRGALPPRLGAALEVSAARMPVGELERLWPPAFAADARAWILEHVHGGRIEAGKAGLGFAIDLAGTAPAVSIAKLGGTFTFGGVRLDRLGSLPALGAIAGQARFDRSEIALSLKSGTLGAIALTDGEVALTRLDRPRGRVTVALSLAGNVADALAAIERAAGDKLPVPHPAQLAGRFAGEVTLAFPLAQRLDLGRIDYDVTGRLDGIAFARAFNGKDVSDGNFTLSLDRSALTLAGTARLAGVPLALAWNKSLAGTPAQTVTLKGALDAAARRALGVDYLAQRLKGTVGVEFTYRDAAEAAPSGDLALDLGAAAVDVAELGWHKPYGVPAAARLDLDLSGGTIAALRKGAVSGGGMDARFAAARAADGGLARLDIEHLVCGKTDAAGSLARRAAGGWRVTVSGRSLDAGPFLDRLDAARQPGAARPPLAIAVRLDRLLLGDGGEAQAVRGDLVWDGNHWAGAAIDASLPGGGPLRLRYGVLARARRFELATADFGALLRLFAISDKIHSGSLEVTGTAFDDGPIRRLRLTLDAADFGLVNAPVFARLLSLASFGGIVALLDGDGVPFKRLHAVLVYASDRIDIEELSAYGAAIGLNTSGRIDRRAGTLDLRGTLVPATLLNMALGGVPVLGNLLLGGKNEGVFAVNFRVAGPIGDSHVSANPLSAIAPGALRRLFIFSPLNPAPAPEP